MSSCSLIPRNECFFSIDVTQALESMLQENHRVIIQELAAINESFWYQAEELHDVLSVMPLFFFGSIPRIAREICPRTCNIIKSIPNVCAASFSLLQPNCQLRPHRGLELNNKMLRCHYGLIVPNLCGIVCENHVEIHKEKKLIAFDDTLIHTTFNFDKKNRYVLTIDLQRPKTIRVGKSLSDFSYIFNHVLPNYFSNEEIDDVKLKIDEFMRS